MIQTPPTKHIIGLAALAALSSTQGLSTEGEAQLKPASSNALQERTIYVDVRAQGDAICLLYQPQTNRVEEFPVSTRDQTLTPHGIRVSAYIDWLKELRQQQNLESGATAGLATGLATGAGLATNQIGLNHTAAANSKKKADSLNAAAKAFVKDIDLTAKWGRVHNKADLLTSKFNNYSRTLRLGMNEVLEQTRLQGKTLELRVLSVLSASVAAGLTLKAAQQQINFDQEEAYLNQIILDDQLTLDRPAYRKLKLALTKAKDRLAYETGFCAD